MDKKEMIVDGIDVSACEGAKVICYDVNIICISQYAKCEKSYCKDNKDCLYKQLQRKIHECDHRADSEAALEELCTKQSLQLREVEDIVKQFCDACEEFEPEKKGRNCMYCNYNKIMEATKK